MSSPTHPAEEPLSLDVIFDDEGHARTPSRVRWSDDGATLSFLWSQAGERDLWVLRSGDSAPEVLLRAGELSWEGSTLGYDDYSWSPDGSALLLTKGGDLFLYHLASKQVRRLTESEEKSEDPRFSPDGENLAFVREADLWTLHLETGEETRRTHDGQENLVLNGKPDWLYWEELWGRRSVGYWWSPDGRRIAFYRFDESAVPTHPLVHHESRDPRLEKQPYPRAGEPNPDVRVGVVELATGATVWMETGGASSYLARVRWAADGSRLLILRLARSQQRLDALVCDVAEGGCEILFSESSESWIDVDDDFALLDDGRLVWGSDRDGWRRLYLLDESGRLQHGLTPEGLAVARLVRVEEEKGEIYFTGFVTRAMGAMHRRLYRSGLDGSEPVALSPEEGWAHASVAPGGGAWVLTHSTANTSPRSWLAREEELRIDLPHAEPSAYDRAALPQWEFLEIAASDGPVLPARILKPPHFASEGPYPVIMYHYGGPATQTVWNTSTRRPTRDLWHMRMAQRGYVVLNVDNSASAYFGKNGARRLHLRFGELELQAQLAAVEYLRQQSWADPDRIGLWGWSGGGSNTLYSVFKSPGTWKAAVAGAPVTDWRLYDTIWTERYLGHPEQNPEGYQESSPVTWAPGLQDHLLVVHGLSDDNVHPHNTLLLSHALIQAGLPFDQALYPGEKHGFENDAARHFYARMEAFFDRWLD